jgi:hypothetical protein
VVSSVAVSILFATFSYFPTSVISPFFFTSSTFLTSSTFTISSYLSTIDLSCPITGVSFSCDHSLLHLSSMTYTAT